MKTSNQGSASPDNNPETGSRRSRQDETFSELLPDTLNRRLGLEGVPRRSRNEQPARNGDGR